MKKTWMFFWKTVWVAHEFMGISFGKYAPWIFAQMIGCKKYKKIN